MKFQVINKSSQGCVLEGRFRDPKSGITYSSSAKVVIPPNGCAKFRSDLFTNECMDGGKSLDVHLMSTDGKSLQTCDHYDFQENAYATLEMGSDGYLQMHFFKEKEGGKEKESTGFFGWLRYVSFI